MDRRTQTEGRREPGKYYGLKQSVLAALTPEYTGGVSLKKHILAICDSEQEYAYHLMEYLCRKDGFPYEVQVFTDSENLGLYAKQTPIDMLVVAETDYRVQMQEWNTGQTLILEDGNSAEEKAGERNIPVISKYQPVSSIVKKVMEMAAEDIRMTAAVPGKKTANIIGIYTPVGRCLQTTFSFVLGQLLARTHKVLYLNFEPYSGLGKMLHREFGMDLSDLIYFLQNGRERFPYRLESMMENVNGMELIPPVFSCIDLGLIERKEWLELLDVLENDTGYDYILLDLSDVVQGLFDILRRCTRIYTIVREDGFASAKMEQYEALLGRMEYDDVLSKTKKFQLPVFTKLPQGLERMTTGELAEYVKALWREEGKELL